MKTDFSTLDIVKGLKKLPRERFREWVNRDYVTPSIPAKGQGTKAVFTINDVYEVELFRTLVENGFHREGAGLFLKTFRAKLKSMKEVASFEPTYILFRMVGEDITFVDILGAGAWKLDVQTGSIDWRASNPRLQKEAANADLLPGFDSLIKISRRDSSRGNWSGLYIVNFGVLRKEVDAAMSKL